MSVACIIIIYINVAAEWVKVQNSSLEGATHVTKILDLFLVRSVAPLFGCNGIDPNAILCTSVIPYGLYRVLNQVLGRPSTNKYPKTRGRARARQRDTQREWTLKQWTEECGLGMVFHPVVGPYNARNHIFIFAFKNCQNHYWTLNSTHCSSVQEVYRHVSLFLAG